MKVLIALAFFITVASCASIADRRDDPIMVIDGTLNVAYIKMRLIGRNLDQLNATDLKGLIAEACDTKVNALKDGDNEVLELTLNYYPCTVLGMSQDFLQWLLWAMVVLCAVLFVFKSMLEKMLEEKRMRRALRQKSVQMSFPNRPIKVIRLQAI